MTYLKTIASAARTVTLPLAAALALSACRKAEVAPLPEGVVGVRITAAVETGITAERITVIPNNVAPWVSQILLLEEGRIYRTTATGANAQAVNAGDVKDMIGLMREGKAGTALTLTQDGKLTALIEKDDEGRLARMNVSAKAAVYDGFCQSAKAPTDELTAFAGRKLITLGVNYDGDDLMRITEKGSSSLPKNVSACFSRDEDVLAIAGGQLFAAGSAVATTGDVTSLAAIDKASSPILLMSKAGGALETVHFSVPKKSRSILIEDGLSVMGSDKLGTVFATADSLGGTFSGGAVIVQDRKSDRLLLLSAPFAERTLLKTPKAR